MHRFDSRVRLVILDYIIGASTTMGTNASASISSEDDDEEEFLRDDQFAFARFKKFLRFINCLTKYQR
jgi:hypothetical protein